ncbi:glycosyltransferase [Bacillus mycoides]|uniref:glycosyltransferase family 4 protein n=1 Tax=Bacillus mycoides TaxID=1405 RepID=UPI001C02E0A1|nr:glycosyltransferase family 4 protein [Bacillus mycoides]QWH20202.1 glycosyltransferase [Bacillus mycoides]
MKNILFLTHLYPYPPDDGGRIVTFNTIKEFHSYGYNVILGSFVDNSIQKKPKMPMELKEILIPFNYKNSYKKLFKNLFSMTPYNMYKYINRNMEIELVKILKEERIDLIYIDHLHMAYYAEFLKGNFEELNIPVVLRQHNVESTIFERAVQEERNVIKKIYLKIQHHRLYKYESRIANQFDEIFTITDDDSDRMLEMNDRIKISCVPAGVDIEKYKPMSKPVKNDKPIITFLGTMSWLPNINGIEWFLDEIFPEVLKFNTDIILYIVGKNPPEKLYRYQNKYPHNLVITGFVEDEREYVAQSDVFIVPLKIGGGMRIKILNALAMKKAIITTSIGVEGIKISSDGICIADNKREFVESIINLLQDDNFSAEMSEKGYREVISKYSTEKILRKHAMELEKIIN